MSFFIGDGETTQPLAPGDARVASMSLMDHVEECISVSPMPQRHGDFFSLRGRQLGQRVLGLVGNDAERLVVVHGCLLSVVCGDNSVVVGL